MRCLTYAISTQTPNTKSFFLTHIYNRFTVFVMLSIYTSIHEMTVQKILSFKDSLVPRLPYSDSRRKRSMPYSYDTAATAL